MSTSRSEKSGQKKAVRKSGQEYGTEAAEAISGLHRRDVGINVGINVGLNTTEESAARLILQNPKVTAATLALHLKIEKRHAERVIASLKKKSGLKRRGSRKNGEWYFDASALNPKRVFVDLATEI